MANLLQKYSNYLANFVAIEVEAAVKTFGWILQLFSTSNRTAFNYAKIVNYAFVRLGTFRAVFAFRVINYDGRNVDTAIYRLA